MKRHVLSVHEQKNPSNETFAICNLHFLQVDEGKRPFGFIFTNRINMNMKIDCHIYNKSFTYKWYMNKHVSAMHKEQKLNCT